MIEDLSIGPGLNTFDIAATDAEAVMAAAERRPEMVAVDWLLQHE